MTNQDVIITQSSNELIDDIIIMSVEKQVVNISHHNHFIADELTRIEIRLTKTLFLKSCGQVLKEILWTLTHAVERTFEFEHVIARTVEARELMDETVSFGLR